MSRNRARRRSGVQVSGNPQRRAQERPRTSGPDPDRIRELEEQLARAREAEEIEFDERLDAELDDDDYEDDESEELTPRPRRHSRADQDKPRFVHHNGERYRLPADPQDWDVDTLEAFEAGKVVTAIKGILGPTAWQQIRASSGSLKVRDLEPLMDQIARSYGFDSSGE